MKKNKIKKVLIALDYDPTAKAIAEKGYQLAESMGAEMVLLHVMSDYTFYLTEFYSPIMGFTGFNDMSQVQSERSDELVNASMHYLEKTREHLGDEDIKLIIREGDFADIILAVAKEEHADIIVMGSHSRKWLEEIIMGSVTEEVLKRTVVPLFIVPTKKKK